MAKSNDVARGDDHESVPGYPLLVRLSDCLQVAHRVMRKLVPQLPERQLHSRPAWLPYGWRYDVAPVNDSVAAIGQWFDYAIKSLGYLDIQKRDGDFVLRDENAADELRAAYLLVEVLLAKGWQDAPNEPSKNITIDDARLKLIELRDWQRSGLSRTEKLKADELRKDGEKRTRPKGVTRTDAAFELQSMTDDEQSDRERRTAASDMSQGWQKRKTITWPTSIGIDPEDRQADLFDVAQLVKLLAVAEPGEFIKYDGGETKLIAKLRKVAREPLSVEESAAIRARRATRTTRTSAKSKKTSPAKTPAKTRRG